jgi:hypothetical protein
VEALDFELEDYYVIDKAALEAAWLPGVIPHPDQGPEDAYSRPDSHLPPLHRLVGPEDEADGQDSSRKLATIDIVAYLDRVYPLTEARWVRTGDVDGWIAQMTGQGVGNKDENPGWRGKIEVVDPDPVSLVVFFLWDFTEILTLPGSAVLLQPPTFEHALMTWRESSTIASKADLERFCATQMSNIDNIVEVLLRIIRGEHRTDRPFPQTPQPASVTALAANLGVPYPEHQTHVSLATYSLFKLAVDTAVQAGLGREAIDRKVSEIVRALPYSLLFKALETMAKEFLAGHHPPPRGAR